MSKGIQTQQGSGSPEQTPIPPPEGAELPLGTPGKDGPKRPSAGIPQGSKVHRISREGELYTPEKKERQTPALLTAGQYLRRSPQDTAVSGLILSLYKTKIMSLADWERETSALLRKKTW